MAELKDLDATTQALIDASTAQYKNTLEGMRGMFPEDMDSDMRKVAVSQNVILRAIEAVLDASLPVGLTFVEELAVRLASYAISMAPDDTHERIVNRVRKALPRAHQERMRAGIRINTEWEGPMARRSLH